jgi:hypothetical protein
VVHEDILRAVAEVGDVARQTAQGMSGATAAVASLAGEAAELEELIREMRREEADIPGQAALVLASPRGPVRSPDGDGSSRAVQRAALAA